MCVISPDPKVSFKFSSSCALVTVLPFFPSGEEYEEKQRLDEQLRAAMDKYKYKRRQIRELQDDLQTMSNTMENLTRDESAYEEMVEEKQVKN